VKEALIGLIGVLAPTIADKLIAILSKKEVEDLGIDLILTIMLLEQNQNIIKGLSNMNENMAEMLGGMKEILREVKTIGEGIIVLLRRTES